MLTAIRVGNFKAFADAQKIPVRPLTLIYGANSAGKSSILHALIHARHAMETGDLDVHRTNVGGEAVDLGGFRQFIHRRDVSQRMEWSAELDTACFTGRLAELLAPVKRLTISLSIGIALDDHGRPLPGASPEVHAYEVLGDGRCLVRMSKRAGGKLQLDRLDHEHPVFRQVIKAIIETSTTTENIQPSDYEGLEEAITEVVPEIVVQVGRFLPEKLAKSQVFNPGAQVSLFPVSRGRRKEDLAAAVRFFIPRTLGELIHGISQAVEAELSQLQYLGPLRSYPPRHLAFSQHHDPNWYAGGGYAWDVVRRDASVRKLVNEWLSSPDRLQTPYELRIRHLLTIDDLDQDYAAIIEELEQRFTGDEPYDWDLFGEIYAALEKIKQNEEKLTEVHEINLVDMRSNTIVSHRDVGIGVSQVLPVLVTSYASKNRIIAIEQPEIHLHPALQADLGDVFIQSALSDSKNRFLIETHSEHLLLRVMRRMRETNNGNLPENIPPITPEDVCVLFVQPKGTSSAVRHLELDEEGQLLDPWPGGFFEEGYRERFA